MGGFRKSSLKWRNALRTGNGVMTAQAAERALRHRLAEILEQPQISIAIDAVQNAIDHFDAASRADAARRALSARLDRTEFHRITRHARHVDRIVERHDAAMTEQRTDAAQRLVVDGSVELRRRNVGAQRTADLDCADGTARGRTTAVVVQQLSQADAERAFDETAALDVASELNRQRPARAADAEIAIELRAAPENDRHARE